MVENDRFQITTQKVVCLFTNWMDRSPPYSLNRWNGWSGHFQVSLRLKIFERAAGWFTFRTANTNTRMVNT